MEVPDTGILCPQRKPQEPPVLREDGDMEVSVLQIYRDQPVLGSDLSRDLFECQHLELEFLY